METSWFVWIWALVAMLVVSGMLVVVFVGLTVLRLVRRQWTRLASEMRANPPQTFTRPPASRRPPRSPRPEPRDARA